MMNYEEEIEDLKFKVEELQHQVDELYCLGFIPEPDADGLVVLDTTGELDEPVVL